VPTPQENVVTRIPPIDSATAAPAAAQLLVSVQKSLGTVPMMMRVMAHSPALLSGYLQLSEALANGGLSVGVRERIAVFIAEQNGCAYCLSAHSYLAKHVAKLSAGQITDARDGYSEDAGIRAALQFAADVHDSRGSISDYQLERALSAGLSEAELLEIIGHVAINVLTNYLNIAIGTEVDFPLVVPRGSAAGITSRRHDRQASARARTP
jgi:uncharacterized peroxidase-related enzyme